MRRHLPLLLATTAIVVVQIGCTWWLTRETRRNYVANVVETFKACTGTWNPWELAPWQKR